MTKLTKGGMSFTKYMHAYMYKSRCQREIFLIEKGNSETKIDTSFSLGKAKSQQNKNKHKIVP